MLAYLPGGKVVSAEADDVVDPSALTQHDAAPAVSGPLDRLAQRGVA